MATQVQICNEALIELSVNPITSITQGTIEANACALVYDTTLLQLLQTNFWRFSKRRAALAAGPPPIFGNLNSYPLPSDFLKMYTPDNSFNIPNRDWKIEGRNLITYYKAPLDIIYVAQVTDPQLFDPLFARSLSLWMANKMCRILTQSTALKNELRAEFVATLGLARQTNAIDLSPVTAPESMWVTSRVITPTVAGTQVGW